MYRLETRRIWFLLFFFESVVALSCSYVLLVITVFGKIETHWKAMWSEKVGIVRGNRIKGVCVQAKALNVVVLLYSRLSNLKIQGQIC